MLNIKTLATHPDNNTTSVFRLAVARKRKQRITATFCKYEIRYVSSI